MGAPPNTSSLQKFALWQAVTTTVHILVDCLKAQSGARGDSCVLEYDR